MVGIPAICNTCGTLFSMKNIFGGSGAAIVTLEGNTAGPCPKCGGTGRIPDGRFEIVNQAVRLIVGQERSGQEIERLVRILSDAQRNKVEPQAVAERVETEAPEWAGFAAFLMQYLVPKNAGEFWTAVAAIIAIITWVASVHSSPIDEKKMTSIVEKAVIEAVAKAEGNKPAPNSSSRKAKTQKTGRNEQCPCMSGKKYKLCCIDRQRPVTR